MKESLTFFLFPRARFKIIIIVLIVALGSVQNPSAFAEDPSLGNVLLFSKGGNGHRSVTKRVLGLQKSPILIPGVTS